MNRFGVLPRRISITPPIVQPQRVSRGNRLDEGRRPGNSGIHTNQFTRRVVQGGAA